MDATQLLNFRLKRPKLNAKQQAVADRAALIDRYVKHCQSRFGSIEYFISNSKYGDALLLGRYLCVDLLEAFRIAYGEEEQDEKSGPSPQANYRIGPFDDKDAIWDEALEPIPNRNTARLLRQTTEWFDASGSSELDQIDKQALLDNCRDLRKVVLTLVSGVRDMRRNELSTPRDDHRKKITVQFAVLVGLLIVVGVGFAVARTGKGKQPAATASASANAPANASASKPDPAAEYEKIFAKAFALTKQGAHQKAIPIYLQLLRSHPNSPRSADVLNNLGWSYSQLRQYKQSAAAYEKALKLRPNYQRARRNLKWVREQLARQAEKADSGAAPQDSASPTASARSAATASSARVPGTPGAPVAPVAPVAPGTVPRPPALKPKPTAGPTPAPPADPYP